MQYIDTKNYFRITGQFGITADYAINNQFTFTAELLYNGRGGAYQIENPNVYQVDSLGNQSAAYDTYNYQIDYLEFPLMVK